MTICVRRRRDRVSRRSATQRGDDGFRVGLEMRSMLGMNVVAGLRNDLSNERFQYIDGLLRLLTRNGHRSRIKLRQQCPSDTGIVDVSLMRGMHDTHAQ